MHFHDTLEQDGLAPALADRFRQAAREGISARGTVIYVNPIRLTWSKIKGACVELPNPDVPDGVRIFCGTTPAELLASLWPKATPEE